MKISAMIFAAGLGTRLYPVTKSIPKALVPYNGSPLLELAIEKIIASGIKDIVVNVHHFSKQIIEFLYYRKFNATIHISDESHQLLETAGGLKHAEQYLHNSDYIVLYNVDIISSIDLTSMVNFHIKHDALATLAVKNRPTERYFIFDQSTLQLCGWKNRKTEEMIIVRPANKYIELAFSGIHVVKNNILDEITPNVKESFTPLYLRLAANHKIIGFPHQQDDWLDAGK